MEKAAQQRNQKKILIRILAAALFFFFLFFGMELKGGYCFGTAVFEKLGLSPWSGINQGWFYPGVLGISCAIASLVLFAFTTKDRRKTFCYCMGGFLAIIVGWYILAFLFAI